MNESLFAMDNEHRKNTNE